MMSHERSGRVANIVPIDDVEMAIRSVNAYTQTIGVYPDRLKEEVRDRLALHGAQRVVSLGLALSTMLALPQDAMSMRAFRIKWICVSASDLRSLLHRRRRWTVEY
jgi:hypothetical protein